MARIINRAQGLNGLDPLSYMGVQGAQFNSTVMPFVAFNADPGPTDWQNFTLGTIWLRPDTQKAWMLVNLDGNVANWVEFTAGSGSILGVINTDGNLAISTVAQIATVNFSPNITVTGSGAAITLSSSTATLATNPEIIFGSSGNHISFFQNEVYIGQNAGNNSGTGLFNVAIGPFAGNSLNSGSANMAIGNGALQHGTSSAQNVMLGYVSGIEITTGNDNVGLGAGTFSGGGGLGLLTGSGNIAIGSNAGSAFRAAETYNIDIGYNVSGTVGDNNTLRIGTGTGAGVGQLNRAFISGIYGQTVGATNSLVVIDNTGKLGTSPGGFSTGNFIPTIIFSTIQGTITYTLQVGKYTQIANMVFYDLNVTFSSIGTSTGNVSVGGFPIAAGVISVDGTFQSNYITLDAGNTQQWCNIANGAVQATLIQGGSGITSTALNDTNFTGVNPWTVVLVGFYYTS